MLNHNHAKLPAVIEAEARAALPPPAAARGACLEAEPPDSRIPLTHYLWVLRRNWWRLALFVAGGVVATLTVSLRLTPLYESTATIDIDRQMPTRVVGSEASTSNWLEVDQFLATQVRIIQSDSVLRAVIDQYPELREEEPSLARRPGGPRDDGEAPVALRNLKVSRPPNTYLLLASYRSRDPRLAANVANAVARSYIEHTYNLRFQASARLTSFMDQQIDELKAKMERSTAALAEFERELKVVNPEEKTSILSGRLVQLNAEFTTAQADRVRKQAAVASLEQDELEAAQASSQGQALQDLAGRINEVRERFAQVRSQYGANHPEYRKTATRLEELERQLAAGQRSIRRRVEIEYEEARNREEMLQRAVAETKEESDRLNARSFEYQQLKREAEADKELYGELRRRIKEAGLNANFQNSYIRLTDAARPPLDPVFPNLTLNVLLSFLLFATAGVGIALASDVMDTTIRDPDEVRRMFGADVIGTLPAVRSRRRRLWTLPAAAGDRSPGPADPAGAVSVNAYQEAVRALRNSILLSDFDGGIRTLLLTSAQPGEGKSTTGLGLAVAHAQQGRRTLLIDGDLRRPTLHRLLNLASGVGLANVLNGEAPWREAVVRLESLPGLDLLPAGPPSRRAGDLMGGRLAELLAEAALEYDLVLLDAPPLLAFAEPLQMATAVDGVLVVALAGQTDRGSVGAVLSHLRRLRAKVVGVVLNQVRQDLGNRYYYASKYYRYYHDGGAPSGRSAGHDLEALEGSLR